MPSRGLLRDKISFFIKELLIEKIFSKFFYISKHLVE